MSLSCSPSLPLAVNSQPLSLGDLRTPGSCQLLWSPHGILLSPPVLFSLACFGSLRHNLFSFRLSATAISSAWNALLSCYLGKSFLLVIILIYILTFLERPFLPSESKQPSHTSLLIFIFCSILLTIWHFSLSFPVPYERRDFICFVHSCIPRARKSAWSIINAQ